MGKRIAEGLAQIGQAFGGIGQFFEAQKAQNQVRELSKVFGSQLGFPDFETDDPDILKLMASMQRETRRSELDQARLDNLLKRGERGGRGGGGGGSGGGGAMGKPTAAMKNKAAEAEALRRSLVGQKPSLGVATSFPFTQKVLGPGLTAEEIEGAAIRDRLSGNREKTAIKALIERATPTEQPDGFGSAISGLGSSLANLFKPAPTPTAPLVPGAQAPAAAPTPVESFVRDPNTGKLIRAR